MNIHEYQAKALFEKFGVAVPKGVAVQTADQFAGALAQLDGAGGYMVKSQIHAGGRGKGTFTDGFKGGVKFSPTKEKAIDNAKAMLGNTLVTAQTGEAGRKVQTIYFTEAANLGKRPDGRDDEYYLAILLDRATSCPVIVASTEGGMEIEHVAHHTPEKIFKVQVDPAVGLQAFQARQIAFALGFSGELFKQCVTLVTKLYQFYWENIALDGNIACLVNGAGLAMSTMDIIQHFGGSPANFLDVGGGATKDQVTAAFKIILGDANVKGILVNIFGGIMDCNVIATGIIEAVKETGLKLPLVVRLEGNNVEAGKATLAASGLTIVSGDSMADAAQKIVKLVNTK